MMGMSVEQSLVGRAVELGTVANRLARLRLGFGGTLIFAGDRGSGKSRFLRECCALASPLPVYQSVSARTDPRELCLYLVDDADWVTGREAQQLLELVRKAKNAPMLVVATVSADPCQMPARAQFVRECRSLGADLFRLMPLTNEHIELLVRSAASEITIGEENLDEMVFIAQGRPGYALDMMRAALESTPADYLVPESARDAMQSLQTALPSEAFDILRACSVLGEHFSCDWLIEAFEWPPATVARLLQSACDAGILREDTSSRGWFIFTDLAMWKTIYLSIVTPYRTALHLEAAKLNIADGDIEGMRVLARQAEAIGDAGEASRLLASIGENKMRKSDFHGAVGLFARAVKHLAVGSAAWTRAMSHLLQCRFRLLQYERMIPLCNAILRHADRERDSADIERALWTLFYAHLNNDDRRSAEAVMELFTSLPEMSNATRDSARIVLACAYLDAGQRVQAALVLRQLDPAKIRDVKSSWRYAYARIRFEAPFMSAAGLDDTVRCAIVKAKRVSAMAVQHTYLAGAGSALQSGYVAAALRYCAEASMLANHENSDDAYGMRCEALKFELLSHFVGGNMLETKERILRLLSWRTPGRYNRALLAGIAVFVGTRTLDSSLVDAFFDVSLLRAAIESRQHDLCGVLLYAFADVMTSRSMFDELKRDLLLCLEEHVRDPYMLVGLTAARCLPLVDLPAVDTYVNNFVSVAKESIAQAHEDTIRAVMAHRLRKRLSAQSHARRSADVYRGMGWRLSEAFARELSGDTETAASIYESCGAVSDATRIAGRKSRKAKYASRGATLTPAQYRIAGLLAQGMSDRLIAEELSLSVRTVNNHVAAILSKLGASSRTQINASFANDM